MADLRRSELLERLGINWRTLTRWINQRDFPYYMDDYGCQRFNERLVENWLFKHKQGGKPNETHI